MGAKCNTCCKTDQAGISQLIKQASSPERSEVAGVWSHVDILVGGLPDKVLQEMLSKEYETRAGDIFDEADANFTGYLAGEWLTGAVQRRLPDMPRSPGPQTGHVSSSADMCMLVFAFDEDCGGKISKAEFVAFCMYLIAVRRYGFFGPQAGTGVIDPFTNACCSFHGSAVMAQILCRRSLEQEPDLNLIIVSLSLDPEQKIRECVLPSARCVYYDANELTFDEFSSQLEGAAYALGRRNIFYKSVALINHGPDENGSWYICERDPVSVLKMDCRKLLPMFRALGAMVEVSTGRVDFLSGKIGTHPQGLECIKAAELDVGTRFTASMDEVGNIVKGDSWELEGGGQNVAHHYFEGGAAKQFVNSMSDRRSGAQPRLGRPRNSRSTDVESLATFMSRPSRRGPGRFRMIDTGSREQ